MRHRLIPHAQAEDAVLYPRVEEVMHAPGATATMSRDHEEVVALTGEPARSRASLTGPPAPGQRRGLQRILYGLHALVRVHFAEEEEIYLPVLDAGLTAAQAEEMFAEMHHKAHPGSAG
ncbi:hemerythrin domain-containing protein [Planobispora siamensis]|uniref:Hemerythrin HHE cation binding domain-containing protein n=1 Tax=Planobispora siamensis TaxID=936338 RepID=A0A8J3WM72_9ACTN|nr:hemerythrin domain-containing protein [Planobispora siamensis]GIH93197.1 hypothetical protein Psi01_38270 [Planobispora siamensis]